jgi:hypothetical protein
MHVLISIVEAFGQYDDSLLRVNVNSRSNLLPLQKCTGLF